MSNSNRNTRQNTGLSRGAKKVLDDPDLVANIQAFAGQHQVSEQTLAQLETRAPTETDRIPDGEYREPRLMITEFRRLLREQQATGRAPKLSDVCCSPDGYCTYFLFDNGSAWQANMWPPHPVRVPHLMDQHVTAIAANGSAIVRSNDGVLYVCTQNHGRFALPTGRAPTKVVAVGENQNAILTEMGSLYVYDCRSITLDAMFRLGWHENMRSIDDISSDGNTIYAVCNDRRQLFAWHAFRPCVEITAAQALAAAAAGITFTVISGPYVLDTNGHMYYIDYLNNYYRITHAEDPGRFIDVSTSLPSKGIRNDFFNRVAIIITEDAPPHKITLLMDDDIPMSDTETGLDGYRADVILSLNEPCTKAWALGDCCIAQRENGTHYVCDLRYYHQVEASTWPFQRPTAYNEQFWPCWRLDHFGTPHNYLQQLLHKAVSDDDMVSQKTYGMPALASAMQACLVSVQDATHKKQQLQAFVLTDNGTRAVSEDRRTTEGIQPRRTHPGLFLAAACNIPDLNLDLGQRLTTSVGGSMKALDVVLEVLHEVRDELHLGDPELAPFWGERLAQDLRPKVDEFLRSHSKGNPEDHVKLHRALHGGKHQGFVAARLRFV